MTKTNEHRYNCIVYFYDGKQITEYRSVNDDRVFFNVKIPFYGNITFGTAKEVKQYIGGKPKMVGSYELWYTPVGNPIKKNVVGNVW